MPRPPPRSPLFPYTTLFRSALGRQVVPAAGQVEPRVVDQRPELLEGHPEGLGQLVPVGRPVVGQVARDPPPDRKSTRLNSSHLGISYAVFCLKKKIKARFVD